jgi:hypothetical protein
MTAIFVQPIQKGLEKTVVYLINAKSDGELVEYVPFWFNLKI